MNKPLLSVSNVITAQSQSILCKWFSVVIDIVPQMVSIKLTLYWTRHIPLSKRTLQLIQFFTNAVNVHSEFSAWKLFEWSYNKRVPRNCHYKVTQSPSPQGQTLQLLLDNSASKPAILKVWEAVWWGYRVQLARLRCGWGSARVAFTFLPFYLP